MDKKQEKGPLKGKTAASVSGRSLDKAPDEELLALARSGDPDAAEELLRRHKDIPRSKANLYYMLGADREDLVQEGMIGLFKAIGSYEPERGASFKTFAELCVSRQMLSAMKMASSKKNLALNSAFSLESPMGDQTDPISLGETIPAGQESDPEKALLLRELEQSLLRDDQKLFSRMEKQVLELMLQGYDYQRIAAKLEKTPKQIDNAIQRVRNKISRLLAE